MIEMRPIRKMDEEVEQEEEEEELKLEEEGSRLITQLILRQSD